MFQKNTKNRRISLVCILVMLVFIWGNSSLSGEESSEVSGFAAGLLSRIFGDAVLQATFLIRKLGHFTEFALLGWFLSWNGTLRGRPAVEALLLGLLAAMTDETIQLFVPGRAGMVQDVWIDFSGVLVGAGILALLRRRAKTD